MSGELVRYNEMCRAIAAAYDVDEVAEIRDKSKAIELYMQQQRNVEAERKACEIRLRAERKLGELLKRAERKQGKRSDLTTSPQAGGKSFKDQLDEHGITERQAERWQQLADVPEDEFEAALAAPEKPSTTRIVNGKPKREQMDPKALWLWGRLRDFERDGILDTQPDDLLAEMTEAMQADVRRLAVLVADWLGSID